MNLSAFEGIEGEKRRHAGRKAPQEMRAKTEARTKPHSSEISELAQMDNGVTRRT